MSRPLFRSFWPVLRAAQAATWLCLAGFAGSARAAELSATASLTRASADPGEAVQFQIQINGAARPETPPEVRVDGLNITYLGPSQNSVVRMENGRFFNESTLIYVYQVEANKPGSFTIPGLRFNVGGKTLQTQPVAFKVEKGGGGSGQQALGSLLLSVPKKTAYVGEAIPVEIVLGVDGRIRRWGPEGMPELSGEGFAKQKMPEPKREARRIDGRDCDAYVFRTAITPSKAGKITVGPVESSYIAAVPRAQRSRTGSILDLLDEGVFGDPFFSANQRFKARAEPVELEVLPLPAKGRPAAFSGAVGRFKLASEGSPKRVKVGDPVTMKLTVEGEGNFDRVEAPALSDAAGWRAYPPSTAFKASDDLGIRGAKTFDMAVIPERSQSRMPQFTFAFFDPEARKYVTLQSEPAPLVVEGAAPPPPPAVGTAPQAAAAPGAPAAPKSAPPPPATNDILGVRYDHGPAGSFEPWHRQRIFWLAQLVPFAGLVILLLSKGRRPNADAARVAALRREKAALRARLRSRDLAAPEFIDDAVRFLQTETALVTGRPPGAIDAAQVRASRPLDPQVTAEINRLFGARAELMYAGVGNGQAAPLSAEDRRQTLDLLDQFEKSHASK